MSNDKKPKKAEPKKIHGATSKDSGGLASKLADPKKVAVPAKKKK